MSSRRELLLRYGNIPKQHSASTSKPKKKKPKVKIIDESIIVPKLDDNDLKPQIVLENDDYFDSKLNNNKWKVVDPDFSINPEMFPSPSTLQLSQGDRAPSPARVGRERTRRSPSISRDEVLTSRERIQRSPSISPPRRERTQRSPSISPPRRQRTRRSPSISPPRPHRSKRSPSISPRIHHMDRLSPSPHSHKQSRNRRTLSKSPSPAREIHHETVYRDKTGRKVNLKALEAKHQAENAKKKIQETIQTTFSSGLFQNESRLKDFEELERVKQRGVAVYADDGELDKHLKAKIHWDDPLAPKPKKKKKEKGKKSILRPIYDGPSPPNRFKIRPGYRWDGIDRSNGFEVKVFRARDRETELRSEYQKWAMEDM